MKFKREDWSKSFRWFLTTMLIVLGTYCLFTYSEESDVKPTWIGVMSFGVVFVIMSAWKAIRGKLLLVSLILVVGSAFAAKYIPYLAFYYAGQYIDPSYDYLLGPDNFYLLWVALILIIGVPVITVAFKKYED